MDKALLELAAQRAGVELTAAMLEQTARYVDLLREANRKMNLTSIIDDEPVARLHFEDSWRVAAYIPQGARLIAVGTGAGFPGMALALIRPDLQVTLLDATLKKVKFLQDVIDRLE
ncbi:MAG: 16S rRNA (guanine(527)-N(7))-methyltransferase RsmG, partial [Clostridiaceae bacterium]|nr:16S rRNA (guanine(527)-N(7))-methyltransferase RsmG [Clostridiaceae bacterium]